MFTLNVGFVTALACRSLERIRYSTRYHVGKLDSCREKEELLILLITIDTSK